MIGQQTALVLHRSRGYPARRLEPEELWGWWMAEHSWLISLDERDCDLSRYSPEQQAEVERLMEEADAGAMPETRWACTAPDEELGGEECGAGLTWHEPVCPYGHSVAWD